MKVLAIDPGTHKSAWCIFDGTQVLQSSHEENILVLERCMRLDKGVVFSGVDAVAIEMIESFGMPVGREVFETVLWAGRFFGVMEFFSQVPKLVYRKDIKLHLCQSLKAKDPNVRQALIDRFPPVGGGRIPQVGTKSSPGPLYGIAGDVWAALAVACYVYDSVVLGESVVGGRNGRC